MPKDNSLVMSIYSYSSVLAFRMCRYQNSFKD